MDEVSVLVCDAASLGTAFPTFRDNLVASSSSNKELCLLEIHINIYLRLYTTIFHNSEKLQLLFSAWRHVSAAHAAIFRPA